jgi:hypothetical protein
MPMQWFLHHLYEDNPKQCYVPHHKVQPTYSDIRAQSVAAKTVVS